MRMPTAKVVVIDFFKNLNIVKNEVSGPVDIMIIFPVCALANFKQRR